MRKVDIELADMADQLGVSTRRLMVGVHTGRFSEYVTEGDLVHGDKGDPLFFRIDQNRAFGICGSDLPDVAKDMSVVENMSRSDEVQPVEESRENTELAVHTGSALGSTRESSPTTLRESSQEPQSSSNAFAKAVMAGLFIAGGAALVATLLEEDSGLSGSQLRDIYKQGVNARIDGSNVNPYADNPEARDEFRRGWWAADEEIRERLVRSGYVRVGPTVNYT